MTARCVSIAEVENTFPDRFLKPVRYKNKVTYLNKNLTGHPDLSGKLFFDMVFK
ncbi:MAG TPA: hypothetical protein VJ455_09425 [Ignavibacteria bacterium]|nr:hypothetical protein [Ignavibacteria bacterium]